MISSKYPFFIFSEFFPWGDVSDSRTNKSTTTSHQYTLHSKFFTSSHENRESTANTTQTIKLYNDENGRLCTTSYWHAIVSTVRIESVRPYHDIYRKFCYFVRWDCRHISTDISWNQLAFKASSNLKGTPNADMLSRTLAAISVHL